MIIILAIIVGLVTLGIVFFPAFIVSLAQLTVVAVVCYIITIQFMRKEIGYLIIVLYFLAILLSFSQAIGPHIEGIKDNAERIQKFSEIAEPKREEKRSGLYEWFMHELGSKDILLRD